MGDMLCDRLLRVWDAEPSSRLPACFSSGTTAWGLGWGPPTVPTCPRVCLSWEQAHPSTAAVTGRTPTHSPARAGFRASSRPGACWRACHAGRRVCGRSLSPVTAEAAGGTKAQRLRCPRGARDTRAQAVRAGLEPLEARGGHGGGPRDVAPPQLPVAPHPRGSHLESGEADGFQHIEAEGDAQCVLKDPGPPGRQSAVSRWGRGSTESHGPPVAPSSATSAALSCCDDSGTAPRRAGRVPSCAGHRWEPQHSTHSGVCPSPVAAFTPTSRGGHGGLVQLLDSNLSSKIFFTQFRKIKLLPSQVPHPISWPRKRGLRD